MLFAISIIWVAFFSFIYHIQMDKKNQGYQTPMKTKPVLRSLSATFDASNFIVTEVPKEITSKWITSHPPLSIVIENVWTLEECQTWIEDSESAGYGDVGGGQQLRIADVRNSKRSIIDDPVRAEQLWERIKGSVAMDHIANYSPLELNEWLRFLRYDPGEYFAPHLDGCYDRPDDHDRAGDLSYVTVQIYLNEGFEGGSTRFFDKNNDELYYDVVPKIWAVLLFDHRMLHSGEEVKSGRKYAVRTDIMFTKDRRI